MRYGRYREFISVYGIVAFYILYALGRTVINLGGDGKKDGVVRRTKQTALKGWQICSADTFN